MRITFILCLLSAFLFTSCNKDLGEVTVTYTKATAIYGDLAEIRATPLLEAPRTIENPGKIFIGQDFLLIGEEEKGIHVVDNRDPKNPTPIHFLNIPFNREFYVNDNVIYAESMYDVLKIDIADLNNPMIDTRLTEVFANEITNAEGQSLVGFNYERITETLDPDGQLHDAWDNEIDTYFFDFNNQLIPPSAVPASFVSNDAGAIGTVNRMAFLNDYVYVVSRTTLTTLEDKGEFRWLNTNYVGNDMETIYPYEGNLFVGTRSSMMIFDLEDPTLPSYTSMFWHATACDPVYPEGNLAYVTLRTGDVGNCPGDENALIVVDVSNIQLPLEVKEIEMLSPYGLTTLNGKLYVGEGENGLKVFDLEDPRSPELMEHFKNIEAYDVIRDAHRSDLVLVANSTGLHYYQVEDTSLDLFGELLY